MSTCLSNTNGLLVARRYLLCGQEVTGDVFHVSARDRRSSTSSGGMAVPGSSASTGSGPPSFEFSPSAASKAVQVCIVTNKCLDLIKVGQ